VCSPTNGLAGPGQVAAPPPLYLAAALACMGADWQAQQSVLGLLARGANSLAKPPPSAAAWPVCGFG